MKNNEIFKKEIKKAVSKGYKPVENLSNALFDATCHMLIIKDLYRAIIFSHDFAKAFWGEEEVTVDEQWTKQEYFEICKGQFLNQKSLERHWIEVVEKLKNWQYHLEKMVLEKEPLKYLEKFL